MGICGGGSHGDSDRAGEVGLPLPLVAVVAVAATAPFRVEAAEEEETDVLLLPLFVFAVLRGGAAPLMDPALADFLSEPLFLNTSPPPVPLPIPFRRELCLPAGDGTTTLCLDLRISGMLDFLLGRG